MLEGGRICATGVVREDRGSPEIVLRDAHSPYDPNMGAGAR